MNGQDFEGKVALVTGGGSGIGAACVRLFAQEGARVLVVDVTSEAAEKLAADLAPAALAYVADVSRPQDCEAMVEMAMTAFGRLDVAVNNAGIGGVRARTGEYPLDAWDQVIGVNLTGVFYCMRAEISAMLAEGGGSIVNMSSILGTVGFAQAPAYTAAKHGLVGLTKTAAIEYAADGIRVNAVGPGFIDTPMLAAAPPEVLAAVGALHPLGRLGTPEEVAELVAFLASDRASNTTGSYMLTDGGYTAR